MRRVGLHLISIIMLCMVGLAAACGPQRLLVEPREAPDSFPDSLKGYELYIWEADDGVWLTLITGTNREKQFQEIVSTENIAASDVWIKSTVRGLNQGLGLLAQLPSGEDVVLMGLPGGYGLRGDEVYRPPSEEAIAAVESFCLNNGLQFNRAID